MGYPQIIKVNNCSIDFSCTETYGFEYPHFRKASSMIFAATRSRVVSVVKSEMFAQKDPTVNPYEDRSKPRYLLIVSPFLIQVTNLI